MCGIVGYVGKEQVAPILLDGLAKLEYRGYDSAGIAVSDLDANGNNEIEVIKAKGRLKILNEMTDNGRAVHGFCGIGHTRWATHGEPSVVNSHPHFEKDKNVVLVHNGIIENFQNLKERLEKMNYEFVSETDTEVLVHLLDHYYTGDPIEDHQNDAPCNRFLCPWCNVQRSSGRNLCSQKRQSTYCRIRRK